MNLHNEYTAVRVTNDNIADFIDIYEDAFKTKGSLTSQKDKFDTLQFSGLSHLGFIAYSSTLEPAAYYGVYPLYASIQGKKALISQSGDTMTKNAHLGKGLFISLATQTYDLCRVNGVGGVFGFPSKPSYPGFKKKLNWIFKDFIRRYNFFVPTLPLALVSEKLPFLKPIYLNWVRFILRFYGKGSFFKGSVYNNNQDGIIRDLDFWNYKMKSKSNFSTRIGGIDIVLKFNGKLNVGDADINQHSDLKRIITHLKILSFLTFNTHVVFYVSPDTLLDAKLVEISEPSNALPIGFLNFDNQVEMSGLKFTYFDFDTF